MLLQGANDFVVSQTLLKPEFVYKKEVSSRLLLEDTVDKVVANQILEVSAPVERKRSDESLLFVSNNGERMYSLLCALIWPLVDRSDTFLYIRGHASKRG